MHAATPSNAAHAAASLRDAFTGTTAPDVLDRGSFVDVAGEHNPAWMAYWFSRDRLQAWLSDPRVAEIWAGHPTHSNVGYWRETAIIPRERLEALYTHPPEFTAMAGLSEAFDRQPTVYHEYWGAARDRIPDSRHDPLQPEHREYVAGRWPTRGQRLRVHAPGNVCLIRTAQDWSRAERFKDMYLRDVAPVKDAGVEYLARNPDTGCVTTRNIREEDHDGRTLDRACTVAWFLSLTHLEQWAKSHRTHLAIFDSFLEMVGEHADTPLDLALWHEVSVPPPGEVRGEYVNCHSDCGWLRLGAAAMLYASRSNSRRRSHCAGTGRWRSPPC